MYHKVSSGFLKPSFSGLFVPLYTLLVSSLMGRVKLILWIHAVMLPVPKNSSDVKPNRFASGSPTSQIVYLTLNAIAILA